nr:vegetative incompatibility protein het-e-1 [Quercus suber]
MRLLQYDNVSRVSFTKDLSEAELPNYRYAILSHTWGPSEEEVIYDDVVNGISTSKPGTGSEKIRFCIEQTRRDGLKYFWVDTCCIDKRNLVELSRALISMFRWYSNAEKCYTFLSDVVYTSSTPGDEQGSKRWEEAFRLSRWFTRGWTLQELLAPRSLTFFSSDGHELGTKASLGQVISQITNVPIQALHSQPLGGIFDVSMPVLYGEGKVQARARLSALLGRPEMPPEPSFSVPYRRDPHFVKRPALTDQIRSMLEVPAGRVALAGLGGVGREDPKADILRLFRDWLRDSSKGRWLVVLDNADHAGFLLDSPGVQGDELPLSRRIDCIPSCEHGSMMITTRSRSEVLKLLVYEADIIDVLPMSEEEADALLEAKLGDQGSDSLQLVRALECMPLAITQAAAYIRERRPRCSARRYCEQIEQSRESRIDLLRRHVSLPSRDAEAINSIMLTWQISFEHVYQTQRSAAELLPLMSFCDRSAIAESLLRISSAGADSSVSDSAFEDDIVILRNFSFISETADPGSWEMHRLVQDATQVWLDDRGRLNDILNRFINHLYTSFPDGSFGNWALCRRLFPHAMHATMYRPVSPDARIQWASVMYNAAWFALEQGAYDSALTLAGYSQTARSEQLGQENEETLLSIAMIAETYRHQGRWEEAERLFAKVLETSKEKLGLDHPSTLTSMANLASTYRHQGRWGDAERLDMKVMETSREKLGPDHPNTLASIGNLASTYRHQGRWEEAERLDVEVMDTRREKLGAGHPDTLTNMANLASTFWSQGRWEEAERLDVKVTETSMEKLGPDHPCTLSSIHNLASTYRNQGRWEEAERLDMKVMETRREKLGPEHPDTLISMANLASTYRNQGRWEEAERLFVKVLETSKEKLGQHHPFTLTTTGNLASTYRNQGGWKEAERLELKVMETSREKLGPDHPSTLGSMAGLASTFCNQGRWEEAERLEVKVMETRREKLGPEHPDTLTSMASLASTYRNQGRWGEAEQLDMKVLETRREKLGPKHPDTLISMANLASTYRDQGRWEEAERLDMKVVETRREKLGPDHPDTLTSMANLASTFWSQGRWAEAERLFVKVMETSREKLGPDHPDTLTSMSNLASTYCNQGRWEEAKRLNVKVVETRREKLGPEHPDTLISMANLASTYRDQGRWEEAERLFVKVLETSKEKLGQHHPFTLTSTGNLASTYRSQGRWEEAERLELKVMETSREKLGPDHPSTLGSMANLASTYRRQGRCEDAQRLEVKVMETSREKLGSDHFYTRRSMDNLAITDMNQQQWAEAVDPQTGAARGCKSSPHHPDTLNASLTLEYIQSERGKQSSEILPQGRLPGCTCSNNVSEQTGRKPRWKWLKKLRDKRY